VQDSSQPARDGESPDSAEIAVHARPRFVQALLDKQQPVLFPLPYEGIGTPPPADKIFDISARPMRRSIIQ